MNSLRKYRLALWLAVGLLLTSFTPAVWAEEDDAVKIELFQVFQVLGDHHVSGMSERELADAAIRAMFEQLDDPYTEYFSAKEYSEFLHSMEQEIVGIGVRVSEDEHGVFVLDVLKDSPALQSGVQPDDYIAAVDGESVVELTMDQIVERIRGQEGTEVIVTFRRGEELIELKMQRQAVSAPVIESQRLDGEIGYIQVSSFSTNGGNDFRNHKMQLENQGIRSLIIDLRNNSGGILETARQIAAEFITEGALIRTVSRGDEQGELMITNGQKVDYPVIVLVNGASASAAEVLAGALRDHGQAWLLGTQTYGKGSVQSIYRLSGGAAVKVTTEHYLTPAGDPVDGVGLTPNVVVEGALSQLLTAVHRSLAPGQQLTLSAEERHVTLNGGKFHYYAPYIEEQGRVYFPARILAPLIGGDVRWNGEQQTVEFGNESGSAAFHVGNGDAADPQGFIRDGTSYIDLDSFGKQYPQLTWRMDGGILHIQASK